MSWSDNDTLESVQHRLSIARPRSLGQSHWETIEVEVERTRRALTAGDDSQCIGCLKSLVEAVARVSLEIAGEPSRQNDDFVKTVKRAHELLGNQPGESLATGADFQRIAAGARKIAISLGDVRNAYGTGHGRSGKPEMKEEMAELALDGSLLWVRWAVRRLGLFSEGRPTELIRDLIEAPIVFYAGDLSRRLRAANLGALDGYQQAEIGVAVGQRVMQSTFVVKWDGLDECVRSDDLDVWPRSYRIGLLRGLWFDRDGNPTVTPASLRSGLTLIDPLDACGRELDEQVERIVATTSQGLENEDAHELRQTAEWVRKRITLRPKEESLALFRLGEHLDGEPF